jgi:hypothetical protein
MSEIITITSERDGLEVTVRGNLEQVTQWLHCYVGAGRAAVDAYHIRVYRDGIDTLWSVDDLRTIGAIRGKLKTRKPIYGFKRGAK